MELISLSTEIAATDTIKIDLLNVHAIGETALKKFIDESLVNQRTQFFETLRKLKLGTFSSLKKVVKMKKKWQVCLIQSTKRHFWEDSIGPTEERD